MSEILGYIGVEIDSNCFSTDIGNKESKRNPYWKNLSKPIMSDNKGKFRKELSEEDVLIIESIVKNEMRFFGYDCCTTADWEPEEDFHGKLEQNRQVKKKVGSRNISSNMADLTSRWELTKKIRNKRKNEWLSNHSIDEKYLNIRPKSKPNIYTGTIMNRMKMMSYSLLSESITNIVIKKIKDFQLRISEK
jgi:hypothetical protein